MVLASPLPASSIIVVPERYARKAGIIGSIHGATNDPSPAKTATARVTSAMCKIPHFIIKAFFQIFFKSCSVAFYSGTKYL
jgi:hypothetical protein